jgi:hypothetical protein
MSENGNPQPQQKALVSDDVLDRSVQGQFDFPTSAGGGSFVIHVGSFADDITMWGRDVWRRDKQLRDFWPTEPFLASAINSIVQARANMSWVLDGPPRTVNAVQRMLQMADLGNGWSTLQQKVAIDLLTQDNGAFVEIVRKEDSEDSPAINLAHLDAAECQRTGVPEWPVLYTDKLGRQHRLAWYQVLTFEDMPSPIQSMNEVQYCFVTRVLRAAQIIKDVGIFKREKISGRNPGEIHFVGGVQTSVVEDKLSNNAQLADNQGYTRFELPAIIGSLDPNAPVTTATISLRNVPDGFDEDTTLRWYVANLALGAGGDYQDFAPLPSGNIGSGQQSEVLHRKSKGKGHETWRKLWEHKLNFCNILPRSVTFSFEEKDIEERSSEADVQETIAGTLKTYADAGILPNEIIWQIMEDLRVLRPEYVAMLGQDNVTPDITITDEEPGPTQQALDEAAETEGQIEEEIEEVEKALNQLDNWIMASLEVPQAKQIDEDAQDVVDELIALALLLQDGDITQAEFEAQFQEAMDAGMADAFTLGSATDFTDLSESDLDFLQEQATINAAAIPGLVSEIEDGDFLPEVGGLDLATRMGIWGRTLTGTFAQGQLSSPEITFLQWNLGIADHCSTCTDLDGVVRTKEEWAQTPYRPQVRNGSLECGGWECKCFFLEDEGPSSGTLPEPAGISE